MKVLLPHVSVEPAHVERLHLGVAAAHRHDGRARLFAAGPALLGARGIRDRLLGNELVQDAGNPAGDGLKRLSGDALVGLAQPACQCDDELRRDVTVLRDGKAVQSGSTTVNNPLTFGDIVFYQSGFGQAVALTVSDDGKGFDADAVMGNPQSAHGLLIIQDRLKLLGCRMELISRPGEGTHIRIELLAEPRIPDVEPERYQ